MYRVRLIRLNVCFLLTRVSSYSLMRRDFCWLFVCFSNFSRHASKQTGRAPSSCLVGDFSLHDVSLYIQDSLLENGTLDSSRWRRDSPENAVKRNNNNNNTKKGKRERPRQTESLRDSPGHNPHAANEYSLLLIRFTTIYVFSPLLNLFPDVVVFFFSVFFFFLKLFWRDKNPNNRCCVVNKILSGSSKKSRFKYLY